jgi:hypothetical protein
MARKAANNLPKTTEVKFKLRVDTCSRKDDVYTVRCGFFYRMGKTADTYRDRVLEVYPSAKIISFGEVYKPFRGGASVANSSHWYVVFQLQPKINVIRLTGDVTIVDMKGASNGK